MEDKKLGLADVSTSSHSVEERQLRGHRLDPATRPKSQYDPDGYDILADLENLNFNGAQSCISNLFDIAHENNSETKEILAYHVQGNYFLYKGDFQEAIKSFEKGLELARKTDNHIAVAAIGFDYIKANHITGDWHKTYKTLKEIEHIYQELDLVDEKIFSMIQLANFYQRFGNLEKANRLLNLAKNLHVTFSEFADYHNRVDHYLFLKLSQINLDNKYNNYDEVIEKANSIFKTIEESNTEDVSESAAKLYTIKCYCILQECYLDNHNREKSFAVLNHIKKHLEQHPDPILDLKYKVYKASHELVYEKKFGKTVDFSSLFSQLWSKGEVEFCLNQMKRILLKFFEQDLLENHEELANLYQEFLHSTLERLPNDLQKDFKDHFEFKTTLSFTDLNQVNIKRFIDFSRELISEYDVEELSQKSLQLMSEFVRCERGFVMLFDSTKPRITAQISFKRTDLENDGGKHNNCYALAIDVIRTGHPFFQSGDFKQDLFKVHEQDKELLKEIGASSVCILPLIAHGDGIGVIYLDSLSYNISKDAPVDLVENLASVVAYAINNSYHQTAKETDLKSVKKLLDKHKNELSIQKFSFENFIGISSKKRELFQTLQKSIDSNATITLTGESGVGKEMVSKIIHYNGPRKKYNFVALNCAAIPENLLESELFGYVKGAFTDASNDKEGLFAQANGGTLFLDEIGEMPLSMQVKLLRVLQEREVTPIGGAKPISIDVRIICATNRNLDQMVKLGEFREDLYYRINVVNITIPSLRERQEDVPLLVDHALRMYAVENGTSQKTISTQAMKFLMGYPWPGNVRELINVMYNLSIFVEHPCIELSDLEERAELFRAPISVKNPEEDVVNVDLNNLTNAIDGHDLTLSEAKQEFEKMQIQRALKICNGQITSASYRLQMPRPQVSRLVKKYGLKRKDSDFEDSYDESSNAAE